MPPPLSRRVRRYMFIALVLAGWHSVLSSWSYVCTLQEYQSFAKVIAASTTQGEIVGLQMKFTAHDSGRSQVEVGLFDTGTCTKRQLPTPSWWKSEPSVIQPYLVIDNRNAFHLIWASNQNEEHFPTSVKYSTFRGDAWTEPTLIYTNEQGITWDIVSRPALARFDNTIHLAFAHGPRNHFRLVYFLWEGNSWEQITDSLGAASSVDLYASARDTILMSVTRAMPGPTFDSNSVFAMQSFNGGKDWEEPVLVHKSGDNRASLAQIAKASDTSLHVVWGKNLRGGIVPDVIWHSQSKDGGTTWATPLQVHSLSGSLVRLDLEASPSGVVLLAAVLNREKGEVSLVSHFWDGSEWSDPDLVDSSIIEYSVLGNRRQDLQLLTQHAEPVSHSDSPDELGSSLTLREWHE